MKKNNYQYMWLTLIIIFLVLLMINFTFPDLFSMIFTPSLLFSGSNVYSAAKVYKTSCAWLDYTYPPLYYIFYGTYINVLKLFQFIPANIFNQNCPVFELINNRVILFWAKLPFLIAHLLTGLIFSKFFGSKKRFSTFLLWVLNPIAIFVSFMQGQYDILAVLFLMISLLDIKNKKYNRAFLLLGVGGALKHYPFLLLIPFLIYSVKNIKQLLKYITLSLIPYAISLVFLYSEDFLYVLKFSENTKMLSWSINIMDMNISIYLVLFSLLSIFMFLNKKLTFHIFIKYIFLYTLLYFLTTKWFPQRILFILPSFLLLLSKNRNLKKLSIMLSASFFGYVLIIFHPLFERNLIRNNSLLLFNFSNFFQLQLPKLMTEKIVASIIFSLFIALGILVINNKKENEKKLSDKSILTHACLNMIPIIVYILLIISPIIITLI